MKLKLLLLLGFIVCGSVVLNAQGVKVTGKIVDGGQKTLPGVGIIITNAKDSTQKRLSTTDVDGNFEIAGLKSNVTYNLKTSYLGFSVLTRQFDTKNSSVDLGSLTLKQESKLLNEVVVDGQKTPVVQKGDTTEMSASAYKVNVDATAQDLVQKMPGVTVENGTVKAHGEEVKRVLVDGKNYFGEDASMALQNLPAEVIDKVQVYNKMSDQSEFTGFDDGNSSKVLNIVTRVDRRRGENGTVTIGSDFQDKYLATGRLNLFRGDKKMTILGGANNINQQNFSTQDFLGAMGGGGRGGRQYIGRQSGLNRPSSVGLNYTNVFSKKLTVSGSYFFNKQDNLTEQTSNIQNISTFVDSMSLPRYQYQLSNSTNKNFNHRFDMRLEYTIDSANSIIWAPRFNTQLNNNSSYSDRFGHNVLPDTIQYVNSNSSNDGSGYNYSNDLTFRHKFGKKGRTISLGTNFSGNNQTFDGLTYSLTHRIFRADSIIDLRSNSGTKGNTWSGNLAYTEPIGNFSLIQLSYNASFTKNSTDKKSYDQKTDSLLQRYSNVFENDYNTQRGGVSYRIRGGEKLMANAGVDYQVASLSGRRTSPSVFNVDRTFENFLPSAMMNYKFSKKANLRLFYRTSTNPPSVNQLQDVITVGSVLNMSQGNPNLEHEYTHQGVLNLRYSNPEKFTNFGFNLFGNYTLNTINNAIYYVSKDSIIKSGTDSVVLARGGQLAKPQNFGASWNTRLFLNYGFLFMPIKCNLNFIGGMGLTRTPGSINNILNTTNQYNFTGGLVIASNISKNVDFTLSYTGNYTVSDVTYDGDVSEIRQRINNTNNNIWNHSVSLTSTFTMWERLVFQNTVNEQINSGYGSGYNLNYLLWNASLGLKVFKNKAGQVKLSVYDLLNQNQSISHNVTSTSISDTRTNILRRFLMFTFTYTLRNYQGGGDDRHRDGFGPGMGGGGRFGGGRGGDREF
jgi:hypothetical protein